MTERELLELVATQVSHLTTQVDRLTGDVAGIKEELAGVKDDLQFTKEAVIRIENDHGQKLGALLDCYIQNAKRLVRHEAIISKKY